MNTTESLRAGYLWVRELNRRVVSSRVVTAAGKSGNGPVHNLGRDS